MIKGHKKPDAAKPGTSLVSIRKWLFSAISASDSDVRAHCNVPLHKQCIPAVKIFVFLDTAKNISIFDGH